MTPADFVKSKLSETEASLAEISEATGVSVRSLQMLKAGESENAGMARINAIARYFGYRFEPVPIGGTPESKAAA